MLRSTVLVLASVLVLGSCKKTSVEDVHEYKETRTTYVERLSMSYPSILGFNLPWVVNIPTIGASFTEKYQSNNPYLNLVEDVKPIELKVTLVAPADEDFSFVKNKKIYISAPGQPEILLAQAYNLDDNVGKVLTIIPEDVRLDKYMTQEMSMRVEIDADKSLVQDVTVVVDMKVDVRVKN